VRRHTRKRGRWVELEGAFEIELGGKEVLSLNPTDRRSELICEELNKDNICQHLAVFRAAPIIFLPLLEDLIETRGRGWVMDDLSVLAGDGKRFSDEIRNIFPDEHIGIEGIWIDLFRKVYRNHQYHDKLYKSKSTYKLGRVRHLPRGSENGMGHQYRAKE